MPVNEAEVSDMTFTSKRRFIIESIYHYNDTIGTKYHFKDSRNNNSTVMKDQLSGFSLVRKGKRVAVVDIEGGKLSTHNECRDVQFYMAAVGDEATKCLKSTKHPTIGILD
jgi:hypothetical protein